jgi:methylisocitrate lyase
MGYAMLIWPVSALRVAARAHEELYATLRRDGSAEAALPRMQTREELYRTIGYTDYEALDASIIASTAPSLSK